MKNQSSKSKNFCLLLIACFLFLVTGSARASTLYFLPQGQTIYQDDSFIIELRIDTGEQEINVVGADLSFPADSLEFIEFNKGGSLLTLWPKEPVISENKISFVAGLPNGFRGNGLISRIIFRAKEISQAEINFENTSQVLLNDGRGRADSLIFLKGTYEIVERPKDLPQISSSSHFDQYQWSKLNTIHIHWDLIEETEYSYLLSFDPLAQPDEIVDQPEGDKSFWVGNIKYADLNDGIYYFTLRQKLANKNWSEAVSYRAMIDSTPPEEFDLKISQEPGMFEGRYFLSFSTNDQTSGMAYYEIKEGKREFKKTVSPYLLEDQNLRSKIVVRAVDQAGNERIAEYNPEKKTIIIYPLILITVIVLVIILRITRKFLISNE